MTVSIGLIKWPEDSKSCVQLYLNFLLKVTEILEIAFQDVENDPIRFTHEYLNGIKTEDEREAVLSFWWNYIDSNDGIRNFKDKPFLMARLAICFLSIKEKDISEIGEHLSWFIEVLGFLGLNLSKVVILMSDYFEFTPRQ
ncbi:hypothetical protein [Xenorhabdus szentirmaii]|uniref:hypothetical protein n=1 Tax=Xenorhabdus szentirmaii TaxID=290112 RepID=UPI000C05457D|nr:hypothetical protein [Xenorhabdus szentirmaii]PHM43439.1 hypothetical protein Xszus_03228 [Xenorhabdus szentirmaii]PHM43445.1 hypothetical protein Xszus_03235 [Xenorhabdus szentirmaii]PHM44405.1 hypothetical protein Xszus_04238 [Xenorhabdus szentirmaii]